MVVPDGPISVLRVKLDRLTLYAWFSVISASCLVGIFVGHTNKFQSIFAF
ncbi:hypothetical protein C3B55_00318 [Candidatus Pseudomonas adelgestsugas]|uniref:Uncharacterized protein n=1 Tax=Candidatus Pseudomonas adelgestsugas TaxID=1302376 RepID=A0ABX5R8R5_9PSED|nr:hypothetical protein C3B55_00318 [Candidatus Pseudomonas adelgestsugas]